MTTEPRGTGTAGELGKPYLLTDREYGLIGMALGALAGGMPGSVTGKLAAGLARNISDQRRRDQAPAGGAGVTLTADERAEICIALMDAASKYGRGVQTGQLLNAVLSALPALNLALVRTSNQGEG